MINNIDPRAIKTSNGKTYVKYARLERALVERRSEAFGAFDAKGREKGYTVAIVRCTNVIDSEGSWLAGVEVADLFDGESFEVCPHALRDGKQFGATPVASEKRFKTFAEAAAYRDQLFAKASKAASK